MKTTLNPQELGTIQRLHAVLDHLKASFIGKDEIIDLMGICLAGRENLFLLGPPGTAKSAMVRGLARLLHGQTFEYLLTRFTEPNELFGPFDIRRLREGDLVTNTEGMLPEASLIFLDELLNANSAILNSLLMVLNERVFRRGKETRDLPALMIVGASNHLPEDDVLQALFDRFLLRVHCDSVDPAQLGAVLQAGWRLESRLNENAPSITVEEIRALQAITAEVNLGGILPQYIELIGKLRSAGIPISDRRAVKLQKMIAASALMCSRMEAMPSDLWVMRYIWDTEEQGEVIAGIIKPLVDGDAGKPGIHPRALENTLPSADDIYSEVEHLAGQWEKPDISPAERSVIKDRLRYLNSRSEWIHNAEQQAYVQQPINILWQKIMHAE